MKRHQKNQDRPAYTISYRFRLAQDAHEPYPGLLEAYIEISGAPRPYLVRYVHRYQAFRPSGGTPCIQAVNVAIKRLTNWKKMWENTPKRPVKIIHQNYRMDKQLYEVGVRTEVRWQGFTWSTVNSLVYVRDDHELLDIANTDRQEIDVELPLDAIVTYPGEEPEDEGLSMGELGTLLGAYRKKE